MIRRGLITLLGLLLLWQAVVMVFALPAYILPPPGRVAQTLVSRWDFLLPQAAVTLLEIVLGLLLGGLVATSSAIAMAATARARRWLMPVIVASQAIPVFAIAPILVLWLGYGLAAKVVMAALIIFFPLTATLYDGLRRTDQGLLDLARIMTAGQRGARWRIIRQIRLPAALPAAVAGLKVSASLAPIGAVIGEWVGSSQGLGYVMIQANARMQIDVLFAALFCLIVMTLALYAVFDRVGEWLLPWAKAQPG